MSPFRHPRAFLAVLIVASVIVRIALAANGGQNAFPDEARYLRGAQLYLALTHGNLHGLRELIALPEHNLFIFVSALAAAGQHLLAQLTPFGDFTRAENVEFTAWIGAGVLSLFSALTIFCTHRLARVIGAGEDEAGWAALLMAAANTGFFHARHLLPYPAAVAFALAALTAGVSRPTAGRAVLCGLLTGATYHLYNGYWFLVPTLWLAHAFWWRAEPNRTRLIAWNAAATMAALVLPIALGLAAVGSGYWTRLRSFSETVSQGLFAEGWSLPWEYLWHCEGLTGVALALTILGATFLALRQRASIPPRVQLGWLALASMYGWVVLFSTGLGRFVVYGRTVLPFTPLICLLGGWALARILADRPRRQWFVVGTIAAAAVLHFHPHFNLVFPREFEVAVLRNYGNPKRTFSYSGSLYIPLTLPVNRPDLLLVNGQMLYPLRDPVPVPAGIPLLRLDHVLSHPIFQYEGFSPRERRLVRQHGATMSLLRLAQPGDVPDHPPPALRFGHTDRSTGR